MVRIKKDKTIIPINTAKKVKKGDPASLVALNVPTKRLPSYKKADFSKKVRTLNPFMQQLLNLYKKIALNSENFLVHRILKLLSTTRSNRQPLKISKLLEQVIFSKKAENYQNNTIVFVGKVLNDENLIEIPKIKLVCLKISASVKKRIEMAGGEVHTLEKLFKVSPQLTDCILVQSDRTERKAYKYFGATGEKGSEAYPRATKKGRGGERRINNNKQKLPY